MTTTNDVPAFFIPSRNTIYSTGFIPEGQHEPVSLCSFETLAEMQIRFPDMELLSLDEAESRQSAGKIQPWKEITEERWLDQLYVLPPVDRMSTPAGETFKSAERYDRNLTSIFARWDGRYFECRNRCTLHHRDLILSVAQSFTRTTQNAGH